MTRSALGLLTSMLLASGPCLMAQFKKGVLDEGYLPSLMKRYQNGDKKAADELGYFYESPIYKQFDYPQAANWYRIAYNAGFRPAGLAIARLITTYKVTYPDPKAIQPLIEMAAQWGSPSAKIYLAGQRATRSLTPPKPRLVMDESPLSPGYDPFCAIGTPCYNSPEKRRERLAENQQGWEGLQRARAARGEPSIYDSPETVRQRNEEIRKRNQEKAEAGAGALLMLFIGASVLNPDPNKPCEEYKHGVPGRTIADCGPDGP